MRYDVISDGEVKYARLPYADACAEVKWRRLWGDWGAYVVPHGRGSTPDTRTCV